MRISSTAFNNNQYIPDKYTCAGENISPPLMISGVPASAKSLVLVMDDPDAPSGKWVHWTIWNIEPHIGQIEEGLIPENVIEGTTSFGKAGYGGPCPPTGVSHRYFFKAYALDIQLDIGPRSTVTDLEEAMAGHILEDAQIVGLYKK